MMDMRGLYNTTTSFAKIKIKTKHKHDILSHLYVFAVFDVLLKNVSAKHWLVDTFFSNAFTKFRSSLFNLNI